MRLVVIVLAVLLAWGNTARADEWDDAMAAFNAERFDAAFALMVPLAEAGHVGAQDKLFHLYYYGEGTPMDRDTAWSWAQRAANQGSSLGQFNLGTVILMGQAPGSHDTAEALRWLRLSAEQGYGPALTNLAQMLASEPGRTDFSEVTALMTEAAAQDLPEALFALATAHLRGTPPHALNRDLLGTFPIDKDRAAELLARAAKQWHLDSFVLLAALNLQTDPATAVVYLRAAASKGCLAAAPMLEIALARLTGRQLSESDQRTRNWVSANPDPRKHGHTNFGIQGGCLAPARQLLQMMEPPQPADGHSQGVDT